MKKQRKKSRGASKSGLAMDKELKNMQILEEEKSKLDAFCEQSLKNVSMRRTSICAIEIKEEADLSVGFFKRDISASFLSVCNLS